MFTKNNSRLNIGVGSTLELDITEEGFTAYPTSRKRYTLKQLLHDATPMNLKSINKLMQSAREGESIGRELT